tara:strand:- start:683 stop:1345 length:663 start_codon:yes stop_codon:yes gene_type:complete
MGDIKMADEILYQQLVKALGEMSNPKKSATNPFFKSKYATLEDSLNIATKTLAKYDLAVLQLNVTKVTGSCLVTRIIHKSGQFIEDGGVPLKLKDENDAQKLGGAITYARRYGLQSMLGMIGEEDDDGNTAVQPKSKGATARQPFTMSYDIYDLDGSKINTYNKYETYFAEISKLHNDYLKTNKNQIIKVNERIQAHQEINSKVKAKIFTELTNLIKNII